MKNLLLVVPIIVAFMFIFISDSSIFARICFFTVGILGLSYTIYETIKLRKDNKNDY